MASVAEQPLKKRRLYEAYLSPDEKLRRRRNRDEIRNLYSSYRRIKFCVSQKDPNLTPDFEQAYLSLITASRGCTSVQRIVAELIPRYASYCPTALEAAVKVSINMYNWSVAIIMRGDDVDGVAYQTAKACVFGLVDICHTASYEAPSSSVIRGICNAVFVDVLTFFTSNIEGEDINQIGSREIQKLQQRINSFSDLMHELELEDNNEPILYKLFRFQALSLLRVFFSYPKDLLSACFEILSSGVDVVLRQRGQYFLRQVILQLNGDDKNKATTKESTEINTDVKGDSKPVPKCGDVPEKPLILLEDCFMGMAINNDPSLRTWILSRYKKFSETNSQDVTEISSILENIFGPLTELVNEVDCENTDKDNFDPTKYTVHDASSIDASCEDNSVVEGDAQYLKYCSLKTQNEINIQSVDERFIDKGERFVSLKNLETGNLERLRLDNASTPKDPRNNRNSGVALYQSEQQHTPRKSNASGYFSSHGDIYPTDLGSTPGKSYGSSFTNTIDRSIHEHISPRFKVENVVNQGWNGHPFQPCWTTTRNRDMMDVDSRKVEGFGSSRSSNFPYAEGPSTSHGAEQFWQHKNQENMTQGIVPYPSVPLHGGSIIPPPTVGSSLYRPVYLKPSSSRDGSSINPSLPSNRSMMPNTSYQAYTAVPFIPSSITPLFNHNLPRFPNVAPPPPPSSDVSHPLPSPPPPLPLSQPPFVPPPPSSSPPAPESSNMNTIDSGYNYNYQWQGSISKSGVHYCTVYASREASVVCKYSSALSEPIEWPSRLDVTKRTDFRHVKATFASSPPYRREICRLLPSTSNDKKGLQDFISYLQQRECAGVIKIPSSSAIWGRLIFILPHSPEVCTLLAIPPQPAESLIALVLPKETSTEL